MKRFTPFIALLAVVVLVGCSGDSPSANPAPTIVPEAWNITALTASNTAPFVNTVILVDATVTKNGVAAPDGTSVKFAASGGEFANGTAEASVLTSGGTASVAFLADAAGSYVVQAQVGGASRQITVAYQDRATTDALQLYSIDPRRGSYSGGDQAVIAGKGIQAPIEVYFDLDGSAYQAIVAGVVESIPASEDGFITVITPAFTGANNTIQQTADVRVIANAGTGSQETATLANAFVLLPGGGPQIFGVSPSSGRSSGGEIVNILGQNFGSVASDLSVSFTDDGFVVRLGSVISVAPDGTQIQVETPRFSTLPLEEDRPQDVTVSTVDGSVSLEDAFIVLADNPTPEIASISPTAGPLEGGTLVTIFGSGFQAPMQVFFGNLTATDVNIFNDTSPANQDRITCVSPNYSQQGDVPPVAVTVRVVAINTGAEDSYSSFTYGDNLYISGNSPQDGNAGDLVIIYGSGFVSPLQVFFADTLMEVVSVSGTEIVIRIPDEFIDDCNGSSGSFKVVLLESNLEAEGGNFTIRGNSPVVTSVSPVIILEDDLPGADLTIFGQNFGREQNPGEDSVLVTIGTLVMPSNKVDVISSGQIDVVNLPTLDEILPLGLDEEPCTSAGSPGVRNTSTPVDVTVANIPGNCEDTLQSAFVIEPSGANRVCRVSPNISVEFDGVFTGDVIVGNCSAIVKLLTISNTVPGSNLSGDVTIGPSGSPFYFNSSPGGGGSQSTSFLNVVNGAPATFNVYFCPSAATPLTQTGGLTITSNDPDQSTLAFQLSGTVAP